ncbi:hypothetical protein HAV22_14565 [Massilia sp. TW-1]|uniref:Novel STAND NTPase 5 domain-containing protein n=1 Tax=Telluria antibiotica TaxID=2717319 RepID=A0ABX0PE76_9BURK|nr:hypothetical protein [Telluria antibiotica]
MSPEHAALVIEKICPLIASGEASLLLGAGFSYKNKTPTGELPTGEGLRNMLLAACSQVPRPSTTLRDAYAYAGRHLPNLSEYLTNVFTVDRVEPWQERIFQYVWTRIYTTNIDNVLNVGYERTRKAGKNAADFTILNYQDKGLVSQTLGSIPVITIHGTILKHEQGFIFSNTEYGAASSRKILDWHNDLAARMIAGGLIVIGNQLDESDFDTHLAARISEYGEATSLARNWIVMPDPDPIKMDNYIAAGYTVIDATAKEFFELVYANVKPKTIGEHLAEKVPTSSRFLRSQQSMIWFKEAFNPVVDELAKAKAEKGIFKHFITGTHPRWFFIEHEAHAETPKIRNLTYHISAMMKEGKDGYGILNVIGPSGSGKTTGIRAALRNLVNNYPYIYEYDSENGLNVDYLIRITRNFTEKAIIVFYNAASFYYSINALAAAMDEGDIENPFLLFILEERTNVYRKNRHHLADSAEKAQEFEFGKVSIGDAKAIAQRLQAHGLVFEGFSELSLDKQAGRILDSERGYRGDLLSTLFSLTTHENFENKLFKEYHSIGDEQARSVLDVVAIMNTLGFSVPINYLSGFLDMDQKLVTQYLNSDLSDLAVPLPPRQHVACRHRVVADFYFKSCIAHGGRLDAVIGILEFLSRQFEIEDIRFHPLAYEMYKNIISFTFLYGKFFPYETRVADTEATYHEAQRFYGRDGIFWLQFGLYYKEVGQLDNAIDCFRTGISHFDSFQTQHSLGSTLLEKYIIEGVQDHSLYDEGLKILEQERVRRGPIDPYPTTTLCRQLGKIIQLDPNNTAAVKAFKTSLNYGLEHFRDDEKFAKILRSSIVRKMTATLEGEQ